MENKSAIRAFVPLTVIFAVTSALFLILRSRLEGWNIDPDVLIAGNSLIFIVTLVNFYLYSKAIRNKNNLVFLRTVYGGMFLKMMLCALVACVYIFSLRSNVSKGGIFGCMALYFLYTFVEVAILMRVSKQQKNG